MRKLGNKVFVYLYLAAQLKETIEENMRMWKAGGVG